MSRHTGTSRGWVAPPSAPTVVRARRANASKVTAAVAGAETPREIEPYAPACRGVRRRLLCPRRRLVAPTPGADGENRWVERRADRDARGAGDRAARAPAGRHRADRLPGDCPGLP